MYFLAMFLWHKASQPVQTKSYSNTPTTNPNPNTQSSGSFTDITVSRSLLIKCIFTCRYINVSTPLGAQQSTFDLFYSETQVTHV